MQTSSRSITQAVLWLTAAALWLLLLAPFWWVHNERQRGITFAPPPQIIPWTSVPQGGVNLPALHLEQPDVVSRTLDVAQAAGFHWLRVQFPWEDLEIHGKGDWRDYRHDYNGDGAVDEADAISAWAKYDALVQAARERGLELIVRLDRPPPWARQHLPQEPNVDLDEKRRTDPGETGPPDDYNDYGDYVYAVVSRYAGQVQFFQIWNEPNLRHEWNWATPDPADFVRLLQIGYTRVKQANPQAVVLFPSLSPADGLDWQALSDLDFLDAVYRLDGAQFFDIFSAQLYGLGQPPAEHRYIRPRTDALLTRPIDTRTDVSRVVLLREIMERYGDSDTPVWISEFGWNSNPNPHSFGLNVSEEQKAAYIVGLMKRARHEWPWLGVMNVWFLRAGAGFDPADPTIDFQLVRNDWVPLPAYQAISAYLNAPHVLGPGRYVGDHPAVQREADGAAVLHFWGTAIDLVDLPDGSTATVDGAPIADRVAGLTLAEHTLRMHGAAPREIVVSRANPWGWLWTIAPFGMVAIAAWALYRALISIATTVRNA